MFVSVQSPSTAQVEVPVALHHIPSTGHCLTAMLANRPLVNYSRKDCQSDDGISPICAVTLNSLIFSDKISVAIKRIISRVPTFSALTKF